MGNYTELTDAVIFDVDGTLSDPEHRRHHVTENPKDFKAFYGAMADDPKNAVVAGLCNMYHLNNWHVIICTGRPEQYREVTENWLKAHAVFYDELLMRPDAQLYRPDDQVKYDMMLGIQATRGIHVVFDDRQRVVDMWRSHGHTCMQVDEGQF